MGGKVRIFSLALENNILIKKKECNERHYFPFVRLEKVFFPEEGSLEDRREVFGC